MFVTRVDGSPGRWTLAELTRALNTLNGTWCTELLLSNDDESRLLIVAGGAGRYLVEIRIDDHSRALIDPSRSPDRPVTFLAAGQNITCSEREAVNRKLANQAVRYFGRTGEADPALTWRG
jgi:hypothetical protein